VAVRENPYNKWKSNREKSDYRCTDTQVNSLVKQQLSQPEYLTSRNRVNPGPYRVKRARIADSLPQIPHVLGPDDMWGWQPWTYSVSVVGTNGLSEAVSLVDIPGATYYPYNRVGGATYVGMVSSSPYQSDTVEIGSPVSIVPLTNINGIPVDTGSITPSSDNMVLLYKANTKTFVLVPASHIIGLSDGNGNPVDLDLGEM
jgi:hypothetical protein